jgi:peroxiredoxin Q/BCP
MGLETGKKAPDFTLPSAGGGKVSLSDFRDKKNVVLYFYPKDDTPGCTVEACGFRDAMPQLDRADTVVLGVSTDDATAHERFVSRYSLNFTLLTDGDGAASRAYGAWSEEKGRCKRVTAVIGKDGTLLRHFPEVKPEGHAAEVLAALG